ncbi:MAG: hypothetical protein ACREGL_01955 [Alphaproteobacteria bacterium]
MIFMAQGVFYCCFAEQSATIARIGQVEQRTEAATALQPEPVNA